MTAIPLTLVVLVLIAALFGAASVIFTPIWAVPIGLVLIAAVAGMDAARRRRTAGRRMAALRTRAKAESVEFTERDKQTLA
ncbi:MAG: hypothetical protein IRZ21_11480 [Thermoleophilaceae bacterium]|nr:hypothetical protein [Thermoleophilaceae bacterium]